MRKLRFANALAFLGLFTLLVGTLSVSLDVPPAVAGPTTLYVVEGATGSMCIDPSPSDACPTISDAVAVASSGDTIDVGSGNFTDNVLIPNSITDIDIDGSTSGTTTVNGDDNGSVFEIDANNVALDDLVITGGSGNPVGSDETFGGGVLVYGENDILTDDTVTANNSSYYGGGVDVRSAGVTLDDDTISDNTSEYGGGISGGVTLHDDTVSGNSANQGGGLNSNATIVDSTIAGNGADGGQIYSADLVMAGSIVGVSNPVSTPDCVFASGGTTTDDGYNVDIDDSCGFSTADGSLINTDPDLGPLQNNGGPTETMAPAADSPALNQIPDPTTADGFALCPGPDQRGVTRPQLADCDIGAVENAAVPVAGTTSQSCALSSTCADELTSPSTDTSPAESVSVTTQTPSANDGNPLTLSVNSEPGVLQCSNTHFQVEANLISYTASYLPTSNVDTTVLFPGATSTRGVKVCFESTAPPIAYLKKCSAHRPAPCISQLAVVPGGVQVALEVPAGDPRFRIEGVEVPIELPSMVASHAVVGRNLAITGSNLTCTVNEGELTWPTVSFTVPGSTVLAKTVSCTQTKIVVTVPNGAITGPISIEWANETMVTSSSVTIT